MLREIISFLVFAVSLIGIVGGLLAILTSPPLYNSESEEKAAAESQRKLS